MLDDDSTSPRAGLRVNVRSSTKDSLAVEWRGADDQDDQSSDVISGYKVRYQAVGSTVVQYSHLLQVALKPSHPAGIIRLWARIISRVIGRRVHNLSRSA